MSDNLRERVARAIANVREGGWPADTYAMLQQHYLTMADAALAAMADAAPAPSVREAARVLMQSKAARDDAFNALWDVSQKHSLEATNRAGARYSITGDVVNEMWYAGLRAIAEGKD